jgi:sugar phosphate isomerase/epimerase
MRIIEFSSSNRRHFLATSSAAVLGGLGIHGSMLGGFQDKPAHPPAFGFGLVTYLWGKDMDLRTVISTCEEVGLGAVELRTEHKHGVEPLLSPDQRADVKKRFEDSPVQLIGYGSNCEFHSSDPAIVAKNIAQCKEYIHLMHDCGGTGVKVKPNAFDPKLPRDK